MKLTTLVAAGLMQLSSATGLAQQASIRVWKSSSASGVPLIEVTAQPWVTIDNTAHGACGCR